MEATNKECWKIFLMVLSEFLGEHWHQSCCFKFLMSTAASWFYSGTEVNIKKDFKDNAVSLMG